LVYQGDWPTHPELLDWLAVEFMESGWDIKKNASLNVSSATYCQDSKSCEQVERARPENRLLGPGSAPALDCRNVARPGALRQRLLVREIGGPPVYPYQPSTLYSNIVVAADYPGTSYTESTGPALYRRSL